MPPATQRATRPREEGQWALAGQDPLNAAEQAKQDDDGLNVRARIVSRYAREGFESIDPGDLRQRFKWWGLYTQRRPGIDGGRPRAPPAPHTERRHFLVR